MKKNNLFKKNIICSGKKAAVNLLFCYIAVMLLFVFSCTPLSDPTQISGDDNTNNDISDTAEKETADIDNDESAETGEDENVDKEDVDKDKSEETKTGDITIYVYYADEMGEYLVGEARTVSAENKYMEALNELMMLPVDSGLTPLIPENTKINSITVENGLSKVDLSKEFVEERLQSDTADIMLIYSIVNTLTEFPEVNSVSLYIDGKKLDTLGELAIDEPIFRRSDLIKEIED